MRFIQEQVLRGTGWWLWQDYILESFLGALLCTQVENYIQANQDFQASPDRASPKKSEVKGSQEVLSSRVSRGEMFGFMSLAYVRDYFANSQDVLGEPSFDLGEHVELASPKSSTSLTDFPVKGSTSVKLSCLLQRRSSSHGNLERPPEIVISSTDANSSFLVGYSPSQSSRPSCLHPRLLEFATGSRDERIKSAENLSLRDSETRLSTQSRPSLLSRGSAHNSNRNKTLKSYGEKAILSRPHPPQTLQVQRSAAPVYIEQRYSRAPKGFHQAKQPSPLRKVSGQDLDSSETEPQILHIRRRRNSSKKQILPTKQKPTTSLDSGLANNSGLKSLYSTGSSVVKAQNYNSLFLRSRRTISSPELHYSGVPSFPSHTRQLPRSTSLCSLKHISWVQDCTRYIGIDNPKLFIPVNLDYGSTFEAVKYRKSQQNELKIPLLTPKFIVGPVLDCVELYAPISMSSRRMSVISALTSDLEEVDYVSSSLGVRRTSSTITVAGSDDSVPSSNLEVLGRGMMTTMHTVEEENHGVGCPTLSDHSVPNIESSISDIAISDSCPRAEPSNHGNLAPTTESGGAREMRQGFSSLRVAKGKEPCYPGFHGGGVGHANSRPRSVSEHHGNSRRQFKRSVSFADDVFTPPSPKSTAALTRSLSSAFPGPSADRPVYLIPPHMRGPAYTQEFEDNMRTLPMPPTDHVTPGGSRCSSYSRDRTISVLSERPRSFWSKVRSKLARPFQGCFGAE